MPAVSLAAGQFSRAATEALTSVVLRLCGSGPAGNVRPKSSCSDANACYAPSSTWLGVALRVIADQDSSFAAWITIHLGNAITGNACGDDFDEFCDDAELLSKLLIANHWRNEQCDASERLWQALNVAVRLRSLESQFTQALDARKREAIYHFAYGLSHELNNPLANIATRAGVLLHAESAADRRLLLETIIDNSMRGSEMLGDLMLVARPPRIDFESVELATWLADVVTKANVWSARRGVQVVASSSLPITQFDFDPVAIREALWCLIRNAIEVTSEGGVVEVHASTTSDEFVLTVHDCGPGLSELALAHCFDPYFSGREAGRGLGLGLSKAARIADLHAGDLRLSNRVPTGCEATLRIRKNAVN